MCLWHKFEELWRRLSHLLADRARQRRILLAYCIGAILGYIGLVGLMVQAGILPWARGDFVAYYTGARILGGGDAHRLYDLVLQARVQGEILRPYGFVNAAGVLPYINPPLFACMLLPLSFLSLRSAFLVWDLLNLVLILASVILLVNGCDGRPNQSFRVTSVMVFAFYPILEVLIMGQSSFVVLFALALAYWALKRDRGYLAGGALALGLVKPQLVALVVLYLLYRRRWRAVGSFGVTSLVLLAVSCSPVGPGGLKAYTELGRALSSWDALPTAAPEKMPNVRGTVYRAALLIEQSLGARPSGLSLTAVTAVLFLGVLALVARSWWLLSDSGPSGFDLGLAVAVVGGLMVSPHLHGHDLSLLILVGWLVLRYADSTSRGAQARCMIAAAHPAALLLPVALPFDLGRQIIALLMLWILFTLARWSAQDCAGASRCSA